MIDLKDATIAVIGLGYVGLPLAVAFAATRRVIAFDKDAGRIAGLRDGRDRTGEVSREALQACADISFTSDPGALAAASVFLIAVPTPVDAGKRPDLSMLEAASATVGSAMRPGAVVVYESTVYPGCTRSVCVPILERSSGLRLDRDFSVGYSPERANPGDPDHRLASIVKVTSGSSPEAAEAIDALYAEVALAGTHRAPSIEVAEAAKVIENTQRDLNIALMNELAIIFHRLGLDTHEILRAARTKWNFLPFAPGLVGGHCIGVDPYYLTHRAQEAGYHPEMILAGRRINDAMGPYVADRVARLMMQRGFPVVGSRILVMGLTFKENCPDLRNSRVIDVIGELRALNANVDVWDPWVGPEAAREQYGLTLVQGEPPADTYDAVIIAVAHREVRAFGAARVRAFARQSGVVFDVKGVFAAHETDGRL